MAKNFLYLLLVIGLIGCTNNYLYIRNAKITDNIDYSQETDEEIKGRIQLLSGHYIDKGNNLVLLVRESDIGSFFTIDDEKYTKISIEIEDCQYGVPIQMESDKIKKFEYSSGNCGFILNGYGVYSNQGHGIITIFDIDNSKLKVKFDISSVVSG